MASVARQNSSSFESQIASKIWCSVLLAGTLASHGGASSSKCPADCNGLPLTPEHLANVVRSRSRFQSFRDPFEHPAVGPYPSPFREVARRGIVRFGVCIRQSSTNASASACNSQHNFGGKVSAVRKLREALGMSQQKFANELEMSVASVRAYESGQRISHATLEKLKSLAGRHMLPDIALDLDDRPYAPTKVFGPGQKPRLPRNPASTDMGDVLHAALDEILAAGHSDAIAAVEAVFQLARNSGSAGNSASKK